MVAMKLLYLCSFFFLVILRQCSAKSNCTAPEIPQGLGNGLVFKFSGGRWYLRVDLRGDYQDIKDFCESFNETQLAIFYDYADYHAAKWQFSSYFDYQYYDYGVDIDDWFYVGVHSPNVYCYSAYSCYGKTFWDDGTPFNFTTGLGGQPEVNIYYDQCVMFKRTRDIYGYIKYRFYGEPCKPNHEQSGLCQSKCLVYCLEDPPEPHENQTRREPTKNTFIGGRDKLRSIFLTI